MSIVYSGGHLLPRSIFSDTEIRILNKTIIIAIFNYIKFGGRHDKID